MEGFRLLVEKSVCERRRQPPYSSEIFHSELIQGNVFGFSCKHSFARETMGLSEWDLQHTKTHSYTVTHNMQKCRKVFCSEKFMKKKE